MIVDMKRQMENGDRSLNNKSIAREIKCDPKTVRNVWKKWSETKKVTSVKQPGQKKILNENQTVCICS